MVLAILVDTTSPMSDLRWLTFLVSVAVVSAMAYFVSVAAVFFLAAFFAATGFFAFDLAGLASTATGFAWTAPLPPAICFSRSTVLMRAMSLRISRIFF